MIAFFFNLHYYYYLLSGKVNNGEKYLKKKKRWLKKYPEEGPVWSGPESCGPSSNFKFKLK